MVNIFGDERRGDYQGEECKGTKERAIRNKHHGAWQGQKCGQRRRPLRDKEPEATTQAAKESCKEMGLKYGRKLGRMRIKSRGRLGLGVRSSL